ncbi:hypothetical protein ACFVX6_36965 [Streptomyces sp. NPDC058289]|uniref:hypothetical protein n=1 Tax=Streptomyces sp. NPDC058289 TaxID=3346425 RepID=UPI0036E59888
MTITERAAISLAEEFGRASIPEWDEWGCVVEITKKYHLPGYFICIYPPSNPDLRLGGNAPILVDKESGTCRFSKGRQELLSPYSD